MNIDSVLAVSFPMIKESVEAADLVINVGPLLSDSNTGGFTREIPDSNLVVLAHNYCQVHGETFRGIYLVPTLKKLLSELQSQLQECRLPRDTFWKRIEVRLPNSKDN